MSFVSIFQIAAAYLLDKSAAFLSRDFKIVDVVATSGIPQLSLKNFNHHYPNDPYYGPHRPFFREYPYRRFRSDGDMAGPFLLILGVAITFITLLSLGIIHVQI